MEVATDVFQYVVQRFYVYGRDSDFIVLQPEGSAAVGKVAIRRVISSKAGGRRSTQHLARAVEGERPDARPPACLGAAGE